MFSWGICEYFKQLLKRIPVRTAASVMALLLSSENLLAGYEQLSY